MVEVKSNRLCIAALMVFEVTPVVQKTTLFLSSQTVALQVSLSLDKAVVMVGSAMLGLRMRRLAVMSLGLDDLLKGPWTHTKNLVLDSLKSDLIARGHHVVVSGGGHGVVAL